jgi:hypothetical protein
VTLSNGYKFIVALFAMAGGFAIVILTIIGVVSHDQITPAMTLGSNLISAPLFYIIGNGIASKQGQTVQPIISRKDTTTSGSQDVQPQ